MPDNDSDLVKLLCDKVANTVDFGICVVDLKTSKIAFKNQNVDQIYDQNVEELKNIFNESEIDLMEFSPTGSIIQKIKDIHYTTTYEFDDNYIFITTKKNCKDQYIIEQLMNIKKDIKDIVKEM